MIWTRVKRSAFASGLLRQLTEQFGGNLLSRSGPRFNHLQLRTMSAPSWLGCCGDLREPSEIDENRVWPLLHPTACKQASFSVSRREAGWRAGFEMMDQEVVPTVRTLPQEEHGWPGAQERAGRTAEPADHGAKDGPWVAAQRLAAAQTLLSS